MVRNEKQEELRQMVREFVNNEEIGKASPEEASLIYSTPIIGHVVIDTHNENGERVIVNKIITQGEKDFMDTFIEEEDKIIGLLPPLPGEFAVSAVVPESGATFEEFETGQRCLNKVIFIGNPGNVGRSTIRDIWEYEIMVKLNGY